MIRPQVVTGVMNLAADVREQGIVNHLTLGVPLLVEVQDLDEICLLASELLIADGVNVQGQPRSNEVYVITSAPPREAHW